MAQGPNDTILVAIRITLRIRESKVRNPDPLDQRRFVLSEHSFLVIVLLLQITLNLQDGRFAAERRWITEHQRG